jgi:hypothetical protein
MPISLDKNIVSFDEKYLLRQFQERREVFDKFLKENNMGMFTCPGCGYPTLGERAGYEICSVCNWEDDGQDDVEAGEVRGGPNHGLTLIQNRVMIGRVLGELAHQINGTINLDPQEVLTILDKHNQVMRKIEIPMDVTLEDPAWKMWNEEHDRLKRQLIKVK